MDKIVEPVCFGSVAFPQGGFAGLCAKDQTAEAASEKKTPQWFFRCPRSYQILWRQR